VTATRGTVVTLDGRDRALVDDVIARAVAAYPNVDASAFLEDSAVIAQELPTAIRRACARQRLRQDIPYLLFRQPLLTPSPVGTTPLDWREAVADVPLRQDFALVLIASLIGDVFSWASYQHGGILTDVVPLPGQEHEQVSGSSTAELQWHTEDAAHEDRPDYLGLYGLRNDQRIPTTLAYVDDLDLDADSVRVLSQPRYLIWPDHSHAADGGQDAQPDRPVPVLSGEPGRWLMRADPPCMSPAEGDTEAARALRELLRTVEQAMQEVVIEAGDCCFIDNRRAVHGRRAFACRYDGRDRWLRRVYVARDVGRRGPVSAIEHRLRRWNT
jgi:Fe(II)/alpha-ketoglutarate-dependent arginine beta-hydroxylase